MVTDRLSLSGDLLDQQTLTKVLDLLNFHGVAFSIREFRVGEKSQDPSIIELQLRAPDLKTMHTALNACKEHGAVFNIEDVTLSTADMDGVLPEEFHSTTNFETHILLEGEWVPVEALEMDCGIKVWREEGVWRAHTCPMHKVKAGDRFVVGYQGVRVSPGEEKAPEDGEFRFMSNDISSERPKARMISLAATAIRAAVAKGEKILLVGGPAIIHSGSAPLLAKLIEHGFVNVLFAGNALAAHDIEANLLGTSLGVDLSTGVSGPHGHTHHLRAINRVRRSGSIANAVETGLVTGGVMATCVRKGVPFVLAGSIRDDGPLPDVITDVVKATDTMRTLVPGVTVCLMVATTLHSVATGNILPASVSTFCVDSDADTVIKLTDRGTHQAIGIVTDCEFFLKELCWQLGLLGT